ncbi:MAG: redoxin, partial [Nitrospirota bacterium]|nr:redoxin [Nitrospirota bacterium]
YLIDKQGNIQYTRIGEGAYEETEQIIQRLLAESS